VLTSLFWKKNKLTRCFFVTIVLLGLLSPLFNKASYAKNNWFLVQEKTQRNLLGSLRKLLVRNKSLDDSGKILVTGLNFPFSPFTRPMALKSFPGVRFGSFDVVTYSSAHIGEKLDFVRFIPPTDVDMQNYSEVWMFAGDGSVLRVQSIGDTTLQPVPVLGFESRDFIIFPDVADALGLIDTKFVSPAILNDGYRLLRCGTAFSSYQQPTLALRCFDESIRKIPDNPYPYFLAGLELERLDRFDEAKVYFERAVALEASDSNPAFKESLQHAKQHARISTK